jgi:hypothetical protein
LRREQRFVAFTLSERAYSVRERLRRRLGAQNDGSGAQASLKISMLERG